MKAKEMAVTFLLLIALLFSGGFISTHALNEARIPAENYSETGGVNWGRNPKNLEKISMAMSGRRGGSAARGGSNGYRPHNGHKNSAVFSSARPHCLAAGAALTAFLLR